MSDENNTTRGRATVEKIKAHARAMEEAWNAATDEERVAMVKAGGITVGLFDKGLASPNDELRQACEEIQKEQARLVIEGLTQSPVIRRSLESLAQFFQKSAAATRERLAELIGLTLEGMIAAAVKDAASIAAQNKTLAYDILRRMEEAMGKPIPTEPTEGATGTRQSLPPALPEALTDDLLSIPNTIAYYDTRKALAQSDLFKWTDTEPWPTATLQHTDSSTRVQMKPTSAEKVLPLDAELALIRQMQEQHDKLSDTDADTLDALMAIYLESYTATGDAAAHIDNILELRGLQRKKAGSGRRGGFRQEQRDETLASVFRLESLWIEFDGPIIKQRGKKPVRDVIRSRAIAVTDVYGQRRLDDGRLDALSFSYRPGKAFAHFLQSEGGRQTALLSAKALKYDPYRQPFEKRLARYFAYIWRVRASKSGFHQSFGVEALLKEAGLEVDRKRPKERTRDRLEKALNLLEADGVIAAWQYTEDINTTRRGWLAAWLKAGAQIEAPSAIRDHLRTIDQRNRPALTEGSLVGRFAEARKLAGWTQSYAADRLRIAPAKLDAIEQGREKITPALARRLEAVLAELLQPNEPE
jgi:DNA-binding XRE family transcriptional regulator